MCRERILPNFHECFYNSVETGRTCFLFLLENTATQKRKSTCLLWSSKWKFSLLANNSCSRFCVSIAISRHVCFGLFSKLLFCIPTTQKMMSEIQTRLKHSFETAIMMTSSKMTACRICRNNKVRKSTGESSRHGLAHCNGHQKDQAGGSHKEPKMFSHLFYSTLLLSHLEQKLVKTKIRPAFPQNGS